MESRVRRLVVDDLIKLLTQLKKKGNVEIDLVANEEKNTVYFRELLPTLPPPDKEDLNLKNHI